MDAEIVELFSIFQFDDADRSIGTPNCRPVGRGGKSHAKECVAGDGKTFHALAIGHVKNFNRSKFPRRSPAATSLAPSGENRSDVIRGEQLGIRAINPDPSP